MNDNEGRYLPENVVVEILSWLPVKALVQFKCVCKLWYGIIASRQFISKHLRHHYKHSDSDCLLALYHEASTMQLQVMLLDETPKVVANAKLWSNPLDGGTMCGPCDGMYYLYRYYSKQRALWNPVTNELKMLPPLISNPNLPSHLTSCQLDVYGFGYDSRTQDYKVVVIEGYVNDNPDDFSEVTQPPSILVYSLRTDSCRFWGHNMENNCCYVFLRDCSYWLGRSCTNSTNSDVILCFDLAAEVASEMYLPDHEFMINQPANTSLGVYRDSVAFLAIHGTILEKHVDIWAWSDEGRWTRVLTMATPLNLGRPVSYWKEDKFLIEHRDRNIFLCDLDIQAFSHFCLPNGIMCYGLYVYKESLVSIQDQVTM